MPLPSVHTEEADAKTTFQKLDRIWAHNNPGEFQVEAMTDLRPKDCLCSLHGHGFLNRR